MVVGVWIDQCWSDEPSLARCENGEGEGSIATIRRMQLGGHDQIGGRVAIHR